MRTLTTEERKKLLRLAQTASPEPAPPVLSPIEPVERGGRLPLSFAQQRLWFLEQMGGLGSTYHISRRMRLRGVLDREALVRALDRLVARHEALRTTFSVVNGEPEQRIGPETTRFHLAEHDLAGHKDALGELARVTAEEAAALFDLERGPLIRGRLIRLAEDGHLLLLTMHHIVSDGWSMGVLTDELGRLYAAFREGLPDPLPALPIQYADYAAWQRRWVEDEVLEAQAGYWTKTLSGAPALLELPTDHPRPPRQDHAGAALRVALDEVLTAGLKALGRRHGATPFMTLLSGWSVVLSRLSGQEEVVIGTATANRGRREIEGLIGFFVNTLALRVDLSGSPSVAELLGRVKRRALEAQQNQDIPFEQVVERVDPVRTLAYGPLFQVMFDWQSAPRSSMELPGLEPGRATATGAEAPEPEPARVAGAERTTAQFDLSLSLGEAGGRLVGSLTWATALFERATAERHLAYLRRVLEAMVDGDLQAVDALPLLPEAERRLVLEEWNRTEAAYPSELCIHELFEAQAERTPDAIALAWGDEALSYRELDARASRVAERLARLGVGPEDRVGVLLERKLEQVLATLAVLKAGGCCVPVDPGYPAERVALMLADAGARVVVSERGFAGAGRMDGAAWATLWLEDALGDALQGPAGAPAAPRRRRAVPRNLAYLFYTSGSTGRPKGVMMAHREVVQFAAGLGDSMPLGPGRRVAQASNVSFDAAVFELWGAWLHGAAVVGLERDVLLSADALHDALRAQRITHLYQTAALFNQHVLERPDVYASLEQLVFGAEAVGTDGVRLMLARGRPRRVLHEYGPTEATVWCTLERVESVAPGATAVPIGHPVPNARAYVLGPDLEPRPVGVAGELYIGGDGVVRGYLGRPELTAERFVADPFGAAPGARLYRTGDLARWRSDGKLEFLGRDDDQVKVRGFRVEPREIRARLLEHGSVRDAVVVVREDVPGDKRLVGYWVGGDVGAEALRAHLSERLPEHMVPAAYVRLESLPLTPNGKVDRKALPAPDGYAFVTRGYEAPVGETEHALAEIWSELLGVQQVGRRDHFFELGGHSLLAVRVISRVRQVLGAEVGIGELFEHPVLADLSHAIESAARTELPPIERVDRGGRLPLSFAQQRLWFLERMGSAGAAYHMPSRQRLSGELDRAALARALDRMVQRHEALRTTFAEVDGEPVQCIAPAEASHFSLVDHELGEGPGAGEELRRIIAEEAGAPFDLERGPLVRGRLVRLAADEHLLLVTMHHIVSDGWSMGVWARELGALYGAYRRGEPDPLPPLALQYADYAAWQREWVGGEVLRRQAEYWQRTLAGAPELLELPADHPRPERWNPRGASLPWALDEATTSALKRLGQRQGTTLFMTLLAGWAVVLGRLSGQEEVVVGTPTANRGRREIEGLIGFFLNTLPLRVDLSGSPGVGELLARVKARALEAQANQDIPFEQVVELVRPVRSLAYAPLFQVSFTWQTAPRGELALEELKTLPAGAGVSSVSGAAVRYDLSLNLQEAGGRVGGRVQYATSLFHADAVERWFGYLRTVLEAMAADDGRSVDRLPLLPEAERRRLAEESASHAVARRMRSSLAHAPFAAVETGQSIAARFRAQVAAHPERAAVHAPSGEWSYRALDELVQRIARAVVASIGPGAGRVGLLFEPDAPMVASVLGALAAGKTYVPLDPAWPEARMRQVLDDAGATLVLSGDAGSAAALRLAGSLRAGPAAVLQVERLDPAAGAEPDIPLDVPPEQLAYLLYTSGSTGEPKGVAQSHRNVLGHIRAYTNALRIGPEDRLTLLASYATDAAVMDLFGALLNGAALHLFDLRRDGVEALAPWLRAQHVTLYHSTPTLFRALVPGGGAAGEDRFPSVRLVVLGGEAVTRSDFERFRERFTPGCVFVNGLGPTESTLALQCFMDYDAEPRGETVPAGHAVEGAEVLLLDDLGEPVELYARGEIVVRSPHLALGYWGRPGLTARAFVPDPGGRGARMYRTGDLGRRLPDGAVEFLGRRDHQVKIRGWRVEPDEVAAALGRYPGVREAAVVPRPSGAGGAAVLVAYFVADEPPAAEALRAHLAALLPEPMVPAAYVPLAALPLTSSGKLDRKALPAPRDDAYARRGYEAPEGKIEVALAEIWAELLGVERVGRHDDFFELGGHSLLAVQVVSRVRQEMEVELALGAVFQKPVLAALADQILELQLAEFDPETLARLAQLVREPGAETEPAMEEPG